MMTPEQRLDRMERVVKLMIKAGFRARRQSREQDQKINILIQYQMETSEQIRAISVRHDMEMTDLRNAQKEFHEAHEIGMKELRESQKLTHQELRALIKSLSRGKNGHSSN